MGPIIRTGRMARIYWPVTCDLALQNLANGHQLYVGLSSFRELGIGWPRLK